MTEAQPAATPATGKRRRLPLRQSITARLVLMSAASALLIFAVAGVALYTVLKGELLRHERDGLITTLNDISYQIERAGNTERWSRVQMKLAALSQGDQHVFFWIASDNAQFTFGDLTRLNPAAISQDEGKSVGRLHLPGRSYPLHIMTRTLPALDDRPEVRVTVGVDGAPYFEMRRTFLLATTISSLLGIVLAVISSYWIARAGLAPLRRMSARAQSFSPRKLSARMPVEALPEELSVLADAFNGALERIEQAYTQLEAFNADVAHELRTPLANLIGQTQVALARERSAGEFKDVLQSNLEELDRIRSIVNDMLFLARSDQGEAATARVPARVAEEVRKTVDFFEFVLDDAGMNITVTGDTTTTATMETSLFKRALTNLIQNAIQHSPQGAQLRIDIASGQDMVSVAVTNPGPAIDEQHLPRLFDRFYRVDSARQDINGSHGHGLGLAIVKAVARMHGGRAFASSSDGHNTIGFTIARQ
ncbi:histidine kinase [Herbaspirillum rubrisubalbicans]|uniref:Sensor protein n=1 Tax=Herbaspirillum rubrisubalbicans TaxID=80842 RepID=A0ABX9BY90_9BURK|nr:heavy metal sensor histidine kinase [Herbaspirillum rubrisubalbicans]RAM62741.1 histidine kinase [Herbaspirillum rubrisubalbicans]RAN49369.1 histidine kinase [Herbaspirillum rubrisubalbicans]